MGRQSQTGKHSRGVDVFSRVGGNVGRGDECRHGKHVHFGPDAAQRDPGYHRVAAERKPLKISLPVADDAKVCAVFCQDGCAYPLDRESSTPEQLRKRRPWTRTVKFGS